VADDKNDQPLSGQIPGAANGKDVLYGWLVGRAAADLGLAQAIAASEAQRAEQIKRLEEALLGQMRELQNSQTASGSPMDSGEVERLKNQVQQFSERQNFLEAQQLTSGQLEAQLAAKIRQLEAQIDQPRTAIANQEVSALRAELAGLAERISHAESEASRAPALGDDRVAQEQISAAVGEQIAALQAQLLAQLQNQPSAAAELTALESSLQNRLDSLQQEVREKAALLRLRDSELSDLRVQLAGLAQRFDQMAQTAPAETHAAEREAERAIWQRDFDERLTMRLRELGDEIRGKLQGVTSAKVDQEQFRGETLALTARIAQLEQANQTLTTGAATEAREAYQVTVALRSEMAGLKSALLEQQQGQPNDTMMRNVEEMLRGQIQEVRQQIAQNQRGGQDWESQFIELRGDIHTLVQRQAQAENLIKQTHALVTQETAQIRGGLKAELVSIEAQLNERRVRDAALQSMEDTLNLRMRELHSQLAQGMLAFDQRDGEIRELKTQVQILTQRVSQNSMVPPVTSLSRPEPTAAPLAGLTPSLQAVELKPTAASQDSTANLLQPAGPGNGQSAEPAKVVAMDLHERLSAEIERKRAELREKSGRWKVRQ